MNPWVDTKGRPKVAIVAVSGLFPGAADLPAFWANVSAGVDASSEPPADRWLIPPHEAYDPEVGKPDHVYCTRGYFLDTIPGERTGFDASVDLACYLTRSAWEAVRTESIDPARVGIVLGHIALPTDGISALADEVLGPIFRSGNPTAGRASRPG